MKLSIVSTMYRSSPFLEEFCARTLRAAQALTPDFELILVNDGSPDDSLALALKLQSAAPHIQVVDLSRNFGHHAAIVAGLEQSRGERVFLIDCDLEEQPEWLSVFAEKLDTSGADVAFGVQQERVAAYTSNLFGETFWKALNFMSSVPIPHNPMTCRLMTRRFVDAVVRVEDRVLYLAGVFAWTGFRQEPVLLKKIARATTSKSTYNLPRKIIQVVDSFSSFSVMPLSLIFFLGLLIWLGSMTFALYLLVQKLLTPTLILSGFTTITLSIWFLGGITILVLGVLGLYLAKVFQEVKRRPLYLVRDVYRGEK
ncbi:MAG: glycosyltransferase family 2 protein [Vicinamibacteria bacterium]